MYLRHWTSVRKEAEQNRSFLQRAEQSNLARREYKLQEVEQEEKRLESKVI